MDIVIIGIDLGKNSCGVAGMDALGRVVLRRRMRRNSLESFAKGLGRGIIAMEACCGAHHLGRGLTKRQRQLLGFTKGMTPCHARSPKLRAPSMGARWRRRWALRVSAKARTSVTSPSTARPCARARTPTVMRHMCRRYFAPACNPFWAMRPRAGQGHGDCRRSEAFGPARSFRQDRHRRRDVPSKTDRGEDRRQGRRLRLSGQGQSEEPAREYPNGFPKRLATSRFFPWPPSRAAMRRRMDASNGARSACFRHKPPASSKTGRA